MNTKQQILIDTALALFYKHGVNSVGINEVLKVSGVAKKTLYNHFSSKEALILAALEERNNRFISWLTTKLSDAENDQEVIDKLFNALTDWFHNKTIELGDFRGCFFINTSAEFSDPNSAISQYCTRHKQQVRALIGDKLENKTAYWLDTICLLKEGAITNAYVSQDLDAAQKSLSVLTRLNKTQADKSLP